MVAQDRGCPDQLRWFIFDEDEADMGDGLFDRQVEPFTVSFQMTYGSMQQLFEQAGVLRRH